MLAAFLAYSLTTFDIVACVIAGLWVTAGCIVVAREKWRMAPLQVRRGEAGLHIIAPKGCSHDLARFLEASGIPCSLDVGAIWCPEGEDQDLIHLGESVELAAARARLLEWKSHHSSALPRQAGR